MPSRAVALVVALLVLPAGPLSAQSFLDALFGSDGPPPSRPSGGRGGFGAAPGNFSGYERPQGSNGLFGPAPFGESLRAPDRTAYRTLCVRMCDGYYFPISYATDSAGLAHDAQVCATACGGEARLFYHANPGGEVESMVDLTGRPYASYPTAFKYRRTLVNGCQCRPQPWAQSERDRHRSYAAAGPSAPPPASALPDTRPQAAAVPARAAPRPRISSEYSSEWGWFFGLGSPPAARSRH